MLGADGRRNYGARASSAPGREVPDSGHEHYELRKSSSMNSLFISTTIYKPCVDSIINSVATILHSQMIEVSFSTRRRPLGEQRTTKRFPRDLIVNGRSLAQKRDRLKLDNHDLSEFRTWDKAKRSRRKATSFSLARKSTSTRSQRRSISAEFRC